jgi:hypothetical protein
VQPEYRNPGRGVARLFRARRRCGFALPLAILALIVLALLVALLLDGAVQQLRGSRGDVALARAQGAAESALADFLSAPVDSAFAVLPRGGVRPSLLIDSGDTVRVSVQALGGGLLRVVTTARTWSLGVRADAGTFALLRILTDSLAAPPALRFRRVPGLWWAPLP